VVPSDCADVFVESESKVSPQNIFLAHYSSSTRISESVGFVDNGLKSLANGFEAIHLDIVKYVLRLLHIFTTSHSVRVWGNHDPKKVRICRG